MRFLSQAQLGIFLLTTVLVFGTGCGEQSPLPETQSQETDASAPTDETDPADTNQDDPTEPADETDPADTNQDDPTEPVDETDPADTNQDDPTEPVDETDPADTNQDDPTEPSDESGLFTLTFQVNMGSSYSGGATVGNSVQGWNTAGMVQLTDPDGDGLYIGTMELEPGTTMEYKFIKGYDGSGSWEEVPVECGLQTGIYVNRVMTMPNSDTILPVVAFSSCEASVNEPPDGVCTSAPGRSTPITVSGRQVLVGSTPLHMKGVAWAPIPLGQGPGNFFASAVEADAELMQNAGINVVRTYGPILDETVLDELWSHGIYVLMTVYYGYSETVESTVETVCAIKDHPAVLGWVVGNEWNYTNLAQDISFSQAVEKVAELIDAIKLNDPSRPASTVYGALPPADVMASLSNVDLWGINHYPGVAFGNFFNEWAALTDKPFYFGEYGADAYNGNIDAVDESSQANILAGLTQEIYSNASVNNSGVCSGGMVFEFNDEWWKYNGGSPWEHNTEPSWQNYGYPDPDMHEEWWGLVDIDRVPRLAYETYRDMVPPQ